VNFSNSVIFPRDCRLDLPGLSCSPLLGASEPFGDLLLTSGQYYDVLIFFKAGVGNASISWCVLVGFA
jgi:hypothetical protein